MSKIIIIGAGPAGLSAGYFLAKHSTEVLILEKELQVGGICKTLSYKGYRFDIGGHRFFTDIREIEHLWHDMLGDKLLKRPRLSRIYYNNKFFDYPLTITNTFKNIGAFGSFLIFASYLKAQAQKNKKIINFEDYITRYFGKRLFRIFFKTYTEKVWGISCSAISADWARQRIAGLSMVSAIADAMVFGRSARIRTLTKEFYYPVLGPGMMYEKMAKEITSMGSSVKMGFDVVGIIHDSKEIMCVVTKNKSGKMKEFFADNLISSMPVTELIQKLKPAPPRPILEASRNLSYRNFLTVNLICSENNIFIDNWIYIHSPKVKLCRIQNYKNWSRYMTPRADKTTLGLEYFCAKDDDIWRMQDKGLVDMAQSELEKLGFKTNIEEGFAVRASDAYPIYRIDYKKHLALIVNYLRKFSNLQIIGRGGRFKYDNMDIAMASGISAAKKIHNTL